jgi:hypothetical protein
MKKINTAGLPEKVTPETLRRYPEAVTAKALIDALQHAQTLPKS